MSNSRPMVIGLGENGSFRSGSARNRAEISLLFERALNDTRLNGRFTGGQLKYFLEAEV